MYRSCGALANAHRRVDGIEAKGPTMRRLSCRGRKAMDHVLDLFTLNPLVLGDCFSDPHIT